MITRFGMAPRRAGLTTSEFVEHWRTAHAEAAARIPNVLRYVQLHPVLVDGRLPLPYPLFDACSMIDFASIEAMDAGFASPIYAGAVRADEDRFIDKTAFSLDPHRARGPRGAPGRGRRAGDVPAPPPRGLR